jgi:hypothetical protein
MQQKKELQELLNKIIMLIVSMISDRKSILKH